MSNEQYYLIKKSDVDALKIAATKKLESNIHRPLSEDAIAANACLDVIVEIEKSKLIDLSDEAIDVKADTYAENEDNAYANDYLGYMRALIDLKQIQWC